MLGDLHEDFVRILHARGRAAARLWYWREAVLLSCSRVLWRVKRGSGYREDAGYALRVLARAPGFSLFTAVMIGLGVGAATSVFSVLRPLVLTPLPFEDSDALVWISNANDAEDTSLPAVTFRTGVVRDLRERSRSLAGLTGYMAFFDFGAYTLTGTGEPERLVGVDVAHDFLDVLGVVPLHGRSFTVEEGAWGGPPAVILSYGFWTRRFAGDLALVGRSITLNDRPRTVVGVLPPTFDFSSIFTPGISVDFLAPFPISAETDGWGNTTAMIGRLGPGATPESAQVELDAIVDALRQEQPERRGLAARVTPLHEHIAGPFSRTFLLLAAAAGTLLGIACVNVSNLILSRSPARAPELAVRKAFGAPLVRLVRQLLLETVGISLLGAALGTGLAWVATRLLSRTAGIRIPLLGEVRVDGAALLFASGVAVVTGVLVGLLPALHVCEGNESSILRNAARGSSASPAARRLRETLVFAQVTLACALLVVSGLLVRSFRSVLAVDLGFEQNNAVAWKLSPSTEFQTKRERADFYAALAESVSRAPGVEQVGLVDALPLSRQRSWTFSVVGASDGGAREQELTPHVITPAYLAAMGIDLVAGRPLQRDDTEDSPKVILVNESAARRLFAGEDPLGRQIRIGGPSDWEVVGVVRDVRDVSPELDPGIQVYFPIAQMPDYPSLDLIVRSSLPVEEIVRSVSSALRDIDASMPTGEFWSLESMVDRAISARRFTLAVLSAFGAAALLLAGLGIYGVLSQSVAERRTEIGIRLTLGASSGRILSVVLGQTLLLAGAGVVAGGLLALVGARLFGSLLFGVGVADPITFLGMSGVLLLVAALAAMFPAVRAVKTSVVGTLRAE
jgi:predicted permease